MSVAHEHGHELGFLQKYIFSRDHKVIGIQFLFSSLIFLVLGGFGLQDIMTGHRTRHLKISAQAGQSGGMSRPWARRCRYRQQ